MRAVGIGSHELCEEPRAPERAQRNAEQARLEYAHTPGDGAVHAPPQLDRLAEGLLREERRTAADDDVHLHAQPAIALDIRERDAARARARGKKTHTSRIVARGRGFGRAGTRRASGDGERICSSSGGGIALVSARSAANLIVEQVHLHRSPAVLIDC